MLFNYTYGLQVLQVYSQFNNLVNTDAKVNVFTVKYVKQHEKIYCGGWAYFISMDFIATNTWDLISAKTMLYITFCNLSVIFIYFQNNT